MLLSSLAVADRLTAWLIGQFPTYALLWRLRFEFLRPIGVYYDMVERNFGGVSPASFSGMVLVLAGLLAAGVLSHIRLARAISCHLLLGSAVVLGVVSWDPGFAMRSHVQVGMASQPYAMLGSMLAVIAAATCLRIHAEYVGLKLGSLRAYRRARIAVLPARAALIASIADLVDQLTPVPGRARTALAAVRATRSQSSGR